MLSATFQRKLVMICEELGRCKDSSTHFGFALCSVSFSEPALRIMSRIYAQSPLISETDELENLRRHEPGDLAIKAAQQELQTPKMSSALPIDHQIKLHHLPTLLPVHSFTEPGQYPRPARRQQVFWNGRTRVLCGRPFRTSIFVRGRPLISHRRTNRRLAWLLI